MWEPDSDRVVEHHDVNQSVFEPSAIRSWRCRLTEAGQLRLARPLLLGFAFIAFACYMLWPLPLHAGSAVQDLGDPLYEIWTMRWVQHQLVTNPAHLWDGNTGYPLADSLLFSEPRISTSVIAWPVQLLSGNDVLTYNVMLIGSYVVVGFGMALLIWELTGTAGAALLAGFVAAFVPYRYGHLSHLNLLSYGWTMLALWALIHFGRRRALLDAGLAALFLAIQLLASDTLGLMAGFMVGLAMLVIIWQERRRLDPRLLTGLAAIVAIPALIELPIALARLRVDKMYGFSRSLDTISQMSARIQTYWSVSPGNPFWQARHLLPTAYPNPLFPGVVATVAALIGLTVAVRYLPRWTVYAAAITLIGFVLSLGPYMTVGGHRFHLPYYLLYLHVPGFDAMRDAARFGMMALIGVQILAGLGFAAAWRLLRSRLTGRPLAFAGPALVAILLVGASIELRTNVGVATVPRDANATAAYDWLATQPPGPVIEFPANGLWTDLGWTIREIYFSTRHWDPIIAAYTSFIPQRDVDMLIAIHGGTTTPSLVDARNVGMLQDLGIRYVLIHHWQGYDWQRAVNEAATLPMLTRVGQIGDATIYTLATGHRAPVSYAFNAPGNANAGQPVIADLVASNDNPTDAIGWLHLDPTVTVEWHSTTSDLISRSRIPLHLDVAARPGLTIQPIVLTAPATPGDYRLTISCPDVARTLTQNVTVARGPASTSGSPIILRRVTIPPGPYRPGEMVKIVADWEVTQPLLKDLTVTTQLLDENNHMISQQDAPPFGATLPTSRWKVGSVISEPLSVRIPANVDADTFSVLIALYDANSPTFDRISIETPDGTTATQYVSNPMSISAGNP